MPLPVAGFARNLGEGYLVAAQLTNTVAAQKTNTQINNHEQRVSAIDFDTWVGVSSEL